MNYDETQKLRKTRPLWTHLLAPTQVLVLIDEGDNHNFINERLSIIKNMKMEPFLDFDMIIKNGNIMPCKKYVPEMKVSLKYYTIKDDFFIFPLGDSPHVILRVQCLILFGDYTTN